MSGNEDFNLSPTLPECYLPSFFLLSPIHISATILSSPVAHSLPYYSLLFFLFFSSSKQHTKRPYCPSSSSSSSSKKKGVNNLKDKDKDKEKDKDEIPTDEAGNTPCFLFMDSSSYHAAKRITDNLRL